MRVGRPGGQEGLSEYDLISRLPAVERKTTEVPLLPADGVSTSLTLHGDTQIRSLAKRLRGEADRPAESGLHQRGVHLLVLQDLVQPLVLGLYMLTRMAASLLDLLGVAKQIFKCAL
jgi:hypothetical protein